MRAVNYAKFLAEQSGDVVGECSLLTALWPRRDGVGPRPPNFEPIASKSKEFWFIVVLAKFFCHQPLMMA